MDASTPSSRRRQRKKARRQELQSQELSMSDDAGTSSLANYVARHDENMPLLPLVHGWLRGAGSEPQRGAWDFQGESSGTVLSVDAVDAVDAVGDQEMSVEPTPTTSTATFHTPHSSLPVRTTTSSGRGPHVDSVQSSHGASGLRFYTPHTHPRTSPGSSFELTSTTPTSYRTARSRQTPIEPASLVYTPQSSLSHQTPVPTSRSSSTFVHETPCPRPKTPNWGSGVTNYPTTPRLPSSSPADLPSADDYLVLHPDTDTSAPSPSPRPAHPQDSRPSPPTPCPPPRVVKRPRPVSINSDSSSAASTICPPPRPAPNPRPNPQPNSNSQLDSAADLSAQLPTTSSTAPLESLHSSQLPLATSSTVALDLFPTEQLDPTSPLPDLQTGESELDTPISSDSSDSDSNSHSHAPDHLLKGYHVSSDGGLQSLANRISLLRNPDAIQHFCGSPRRNKSHTLNPEDTRTFKATLARRGINTHHWCIHASHTTNIASPNRAIAERGMKFVANEMTNCLRLGVPTLCVHLGSDITSPEGDIVPRVTGVLKTLLATVPRVTIALENMIRKASCTASWSLHTLRRILDAVDNPRVKVCVDICHAYIGEYDLASGDGVEGMMGVLREFGDRIAGYHVSDSSTVHGRACEGHANLGDGFIPLEAFRRILRGVKVPCYLETPNYYPSARPAHYPHIAGLEADRKVVEWDLLESVVCMSEEEWDGGKELLEVYRVKREVYQQRIRNILRGSHGVGLRDRVEAFAEDRGVARSRRSRVRRSQQPPGPRASRVPPSAIAREEAQRLLPSAFIMRGGYTMRRR